MLIKWPIHGEDINFTEYTTKNRAVKYRKQKLIELEGKIDNYSWIYQWHY